MVRPKRCRRVCVEPGFSYFKPQGIPLSNLDYSEIGIDEIEAMRLADILNLPQNEAAEMMNISQATFSRILTSAHRKIAGCIIEAKALKIRSIGDEIEKIEQVEEDIGTKEAVEK